MKGIHQQPRLFKQRHGEGDLFGLQKELEKVRKGTTKDRGNAGGSDESDSPSSELSFEALDEAE
jgi:hypothetical protein